MSLNYLYFLFHKHFREGRIANYRENRPLKKKNCIFYHKSTKFEKTACPDKDRDTKYIKMNKIYFLAGPPIPLTSIIRFRNNEYLLDYEQIISKRYVKN